MTDVKEICLVRLEKVRPAVILTRDVARESMSRVTVAPITSRIRGLSSEVSVGRENGLDHRCVVSVDNIATVPLSELGRTIGFLTQEQERRLARSIVLAFDLDLAVLDGR